MTLLNTRNARDTLKPAVARVDALKVKMDELYQSLCYAVETGNEQLDLTAEQMFEEALAKLDKATELVEEVAHDVDDIRIELEFFVEPEVAE